MIPIDSENCEGKLCNQTSEENDHEIEFCNSVTIMKNISWSTVCKSVAIMTKKKIQKDRKLGSLLFWKNLANHGNLGELLSMLIIVNYCHCY